MRAGTGEFERLLSSSLLAHQPDGLIESWIFGHLDIYIDIQLDAPQPKQ
jgi:hypothetical protein